MTKKHSPLKISLVFLIALAMLLSALPAAATESEQPAWWDLSGYTEDIAFNSATVNPGTPYAGVREMNVTVNGNPLAITHYYGWSYENPISPKQRFNIYVPGNATADSAIMNVVVNSTWQANNYPNTIANGAALNTSGNNPSEIAMALERGMIIVSCGAVSRNDQPINGEYRGHSPGVMSDTKAAVRLLRANMGPDKAIQVGNPDLLFVTGTSGGGALSVVLCASGNSPDFFPSLYELGAVGIEWNGGIAYDSADETQKADYRNYTSSVSDAYVGTMAYCPITDLPMSDQAYEFTYNASRSLRDSAPVANGNREDNPTLGSNHFMQVSNGLAGDYVGYLTQLALKDENGNTLTASFTPPPDDPDSTILSGVTGGTFKDGMKKLLEQGLVKAITEYQNGNAVGFSNADPVDNLGRDGGTSKVSNFSGRNTGYGWLEVNGEIDDAIPAGIPAQLTSLSIYDLDQFMTRVPNFTNGPDGVKGTPAYAVGGTTLYEPLYTNDLYGRRDQQLNLTTRVAWEHIAPEYIESLNPTGMTYEEFVVSDTGKLVATQLKMTTPIPYLLGKDRISYLTESGADTSDVADVAPYWYVRHGMGDANTSFAIGTVLYYALLENSSVKDLNFAFTWSKPHSGYYDTNEAFAWLDNAIADFLLKAKTAEYNAIAADYLANGISANDLILDGKTLSVKIGDEFIVLQTKANNKNVSGEIDLGNGFVLKYDIKGNGSNIKQFEFIYIG